MRKPKLGWKLLSGGMGIRSLYYNLLILLILGKKKIAEVLFAILYVTQIQFHYIFLFAFSGEHMTEAEMAEFMSTLLGLGELGGSAETGTYDASKASELLREHLPENITADNFAAQVLGFVTESERNATTS